MGYSPVAIANMALALFGGIPIQTMSDSTPSGTNVALLYPLVMRGLIAEYPWNFTKQTVPLNQLNVTELSDGLLPSGWQNAFALPGNLVGAPSKFLANNRYPDGAETRYEIQGTTVYTNQIALWCVGQYYVDESAWPDHFCMAAVKCFAAEASSPFKTIPVLGPASGIALHNLLGLLRLL